MIRWSAVRNACVQDVSVKKLDQLYSQVIMVIFQSSVSFCLKGLLTNFYWLVDDRKENSQAQPMHELMDEMVRANVNQENSVSPEYNHLQNPVKSEIKSKLFFIWNDFQNLFFD